MHRFAALLALIVALFAISQIGPSATRPAEAGPPIPTPTPVTDMPLYSPQTLNGQSVALRAWKYYFVTVPAGATKLTIATSNASGDPDLYVKSGAKPALNSYNCRSKNLGGDETCVINNPAAGTWWVGIYGYTATSYSVSATVVAPVVPAADTALTSFVGISGQTVALSQWRYYSIVVPAGQNKLTVTTSNATGDSDLYVRFGSKPTKTVHNCAQTGIGGNETCVINNPAAGTWWIGVFGYKAATFSIVATVGSVDDATFIAEGAPLDGVHFAASATFQKCWTVRNTGNTTWTVAGPPSYTVTRISGTYGPTSIVLPANVGPGVNVTFCGSFTAPASPGTYRATYKLENSLLGEFGDEFWVEIIVDGP